MALLANLPTFYTVCLLLLLLGLHSLLGLGRLPQQVLTMEEEGGSRLWTVNYKREVLADHGANIKERQT